MKCKREVRIKSPQLRALRNNLREILYLEWDKRSRALIVSRSDLLDAKFSQNEKLKLHKALSVKLGEIDLMIMSSIIVCGWCHHRDKDTIYLPSNHQWFCPNCYSEHREEILSASSFIY